MEVGRSRRRCAADRKELCDRGERWPVDEHHRLLRCRQQGPPRRGSVKQIEFATAGKPEDVVRYADAPAPSATAPDDVLVKVMAFPINPADLLTMQGIYPRLGTATRAIGNEAVGEIAAVGADVRDFVPGDRVIMLSLDNWREYRLVKASEVVKVSPD